MNYGNLFILLVVVVGLVGCDVYLWLWLRRRDCLASNERSDEQPGGRRA